MFATAVRLLARGPRLSSQVPKSRSSLGCKKPVDPKVRTEEAFRLADILHSILNEHGPLTVAGCWYHAQIAGFKSKAHMKVLLRWMKERHRVRLVGQYKNKKVGVDSGEHLISYMPSYHGPESRINFGTSMSLFFKSRPQLW